MEEKKTIKKGRVNDVIKVTNTFCDEVIPTDVDISVFIKLIDHTEDAESYQKGISNKLAQFGVNITDWIEKQIENDSTSQSDRITKSTWSYKIKSIDTTQLEEVQNLLLSESKASNNPILLNYSCTTAENDARNKTLINNKSIADKIASILCVKVLRFIFCKNNNKSRNGIFNFPIFEFSI